jgi:hypothetical protein
MDFDEHFPELVDTFKNDEIEIWAQYQIHPMYNFDWKTSSLTGFNFSYNLSEIYFESHSSLDENT